MSEPTELLPELLPCPHCGNEDVVLVKASEEDHRDWYIECAKCWMQVEFDTSLKVKTAEAWNLRANRWNAFSYEELEVLTARLEGAALAREPTELCMVRDMESELTRRAVAKQENKL